MIRSRVWVLVSSVRFSEVHLENRAIGVGQRIGWGENKKVFPSPRPIVKNDGATGTGRRGKTFNFEANPYPKFLLSR